MARATQLVGDSAGTGGQVFSPGPKPPLGGGVSGGIGASVSGSRPDGPTGTQEAPPWLYRGNLTLFLPTLASQSLLRPRNHLQGVRARARGGVAESRGQGQASPGPRQVLTWGTCQPLGMSLKSSAPASHLWMGVKTCRKCTKKSNEKSLAAAPGKRCLVLGHAGRHLD